MITIAEVIEQCAREVEPSEDHRNNPNDYIGGEESMELLATLAEAIRALAAQYEGCIVADGSPVARTMTEPIKLPPIPEHVQILFRDDLRAYARLAVEQATAELRAEVERLREVSEKPAAWMREEWSPDCGPYVDMRTAEEMRLLDSTGWTPLYRAKEPTK